MIDEDLQERLAAAMQAGAETSGIPLEPFTDVENREAEAYGEAIATVSAMHIYGILEADGDYADLSAYDTSNTRNPHTGKLAPQGDMIVQMLAAERFHQYQTDCRVEGNGDVDFDALIDSSRAPGYVASDPLTATRLYVLTARNKRATALETPYDWPGFLSESLRSQTKCDVHLLHRCYDHQATKAVRTLVYKRGEFVYAWKICDECLEALSWISYGHPDYSGPLHKWVDDGDRPPFVEF